MRNKLGCGQAPSGRPGWKLIERVDGTKFRRVTDVVAAHAATKNPRLEEVSGNGKRLRAARNGTGKSGAAAAA